MSTQEVKIKTTDHIELPPSVVEQIAEDVARCEHPTEDDVRDSAYDYVDRTTEFVTEDGEALLEAVADRIEN